MQTAKSIINGPSIDELVSNVEAATSLDLCLEQVHQIFDIYSVGHGCLHTVGNAYSPSSALWRVTPDAVTQACSHLITQNKHPAVKLGAGRHFPFDMFDYRAHFADDRDVEALFQAFEANGLNHAYGIPIQTVDHGAFVFVVGRPGSPIETVELLTLQTICTNAVNKVRQFTTRPCDSTKSCKLSSAEREILISLARGNSKAVTADRFEVSEHALAVMLEKIIQKIGAQNVSHAIVLALIDGEFSLEDCRRQ